MPFSGPTYSLPAGAIIPPGTPLDAIVQHNSPLQDIETALNLLSASTTVVTSRTAISTIDTSKTTTVLLYEGLRSGCWEWKAGDYSAQVTADTRQGMYVQSSFTAPTLGCWVRRRYDVYIDIGWFGVAGTGQSADGDDGLGINAAISMLRTFGSQAGLGGFNLRVTGRGRMYYHTTPINATLITNARNCTIEEMYLISACTGHIAFCGVGCQFIEFRHIFIQGVVANPPDWGFVFGRRDDGGPGPFPISNGIRFHQCEFTGDFKYAGFVNNGAEVFHCGDLRGQNGYPSASKCGSFIGGSSATLARTVGAFPSSPYIAIAQSVHSCGDIKIDNHNIQMGKYATKTITNISSANPMVITMAPADLLDLVTTYGLANDKEVIIETCTGTGGVVETRHADVLPGKTVIVKAINTGAGTFQCHEHKTGGAPGTIGAYDGTVLTGTFAAATLTLPTGPSIILGTGCGLLHSDGYLVSYSREAILIDLTDDNNWAWNIHINGHMEPVKDHIVRFIGGGVAPARIVTGFSLTVDNSIVQQSHIIMDQTTQPVIFFNPKIHFSSAATNPKDGLFSNPQFAEIRCGDLMVPDVTMFQALTSYADFTGDFGVMNLLDRRYVSAGEFWVKQQKVIGVPVGGWIDPTGSFSRATFDTTTVTTANLAQRVYGLIKDLKTHGLLKT